MRVKSAKEGIKLGCQICAIFEYSGRTMFQYISNSPEVLSSIPKDKSIPITDKNHSNEDSCAGTTSMPT